MYYYSLTIVKTRGDRKISDYQNYINSIPCAKQCISYEDEGGLHVHLMLLSEKRIKTDDVRLHKYGWSIRFHKLNDPDDIGRWIIYCNKNYFRHVYLDHFYDELKENKINDTPTTVSTLPDEKDTSEDELRSFERKYPRFDIRNVATSYVRDYLDESKRI